MHSKKGKWQLKNFIHSVSQCLQIQLLQSKRCFGIHTAYRNVKIYFLLFNHESLPLLGFEREHIGKMINSWTISRRAGEGRVRERGQDLQNYQNTMFYLPRILKENSLWLFTHVRSIRQAAVKSVHTSLSWQTRVALIHREGFVRTLNWREVLVGKQSCLFEASLERIRLLLLSDSSFRRCCECPLIGSIKENSSHIRGTWIIDTCAMNGQEACELFPASN